MENEIINGFIESWNDHGGDTIGLIIEPRGDLFVARIAFVDNGETMDLELCGTVVCDALEGEGEDEDDAIASLEGLLCRMYE